MPTTNHIINKNMAEIDKNVPSVPLSIREKMTIYLVIMLIKVIKPFGWSHEIDKALEEVKDCMTKGA
jgi:hypothetical protein